MSNDSHDFTKKDNAWLLPDYVSKGFRPGIYLVATPIGNMRDMSIRALDALAAADIVACEDTRVSGKLLKAYGLSKKLVSYNDHSDEKRRDMLIETARNKVVVLISDAGMPLISDPGYKLVRSAQQAGLYISSVPGASAPLTALQLSGFPSDRFSFIGFLPSKNAARKAVLEEWSNITTTLVAFETSPRLLKSLAEIQVVMEGREVAVTRELTKMYEEVRKGTAAELISYYEGEGLPKGEIVLVIAPPVAREIEQDDLKAMLLEAMEDMGTKAAAAHVALLSGVSKKELYDMALKVSKERDSEL